MASTATRSVTVPFKSPRKEAKVWVLSDVNDWQPQEMKDIAEGYEHTFEVSEDRQNFLYKFRIGDWDYANDPEAPSVPDGFGGINNRFDMPALPKPSDAVLPLLEEPAIRSHQADLEDEAYHSSDSATPKASRAASISSHQGIDSVSSVASLLPLTDDTAVKLEGAADKIRQKVDEVIVEPVKETTADIAALSESDVATRPKPKLQAPTTRNTQDLPLYLGLAAITIAVVAYFLR